MSTTDEPIDTVKEWQRWYRNHQVVAQMDEPLVSKDSRENLHDTKNAVDAMPEWRDYYKELIDDVKVNQSIKDKATLAFADVIAEFSCEMSGAELFECFLTAAHDNLKHTEGEYQRAKDLIDLLRCKSNEES
jgi:hypothetical protein